MTTQDSLLVVKNQAGDYFLLPGETLERGRVPAEHTAEIERLMTAAAQDGASGADSQGYAAAAGFGAGVAVAIVVRAGFDLGYGLMSWYLNSQVESVAPNIDLSGGSGEPLPAPGGGHFYP